MAGSRVLGAASSGIARALGGVLGGGKAYQQGFDGEVQAQSQIARALAQVRQAEAAAELDRQKARNAEAEGDVMRGRSALADELMAAAGGVDVPTMTAFRTKLRTGEAPQVPMGPPADDGSMGLGRAQFDDATTSRLGQALLRLAPVMQRTTDIGPDDWAKMLATYSDQDLRGQVLAGERTAGQVGAAQAAMAGKPLFNADSTGAVLDLFGGRLAVDNPMAQSTIGLRGQQAAQARAAAAENYAQAGAANASAAKTRFDISQAQSAPRGVLVQTESGPIFADPRTGQGIPVTVDGRQVAPAKKPAGPMSATLQKELIEADDTAQSAQSAVNSLRAALAQNDKAYSGFLARPRAVLASNIPGVQTPGADATIDIDNLMTGQALESLKGIFGAAPTEGERKILMDMQASVDKTPEQRRTIIERAIKAAEWRGVYATNKAKAIREGTYLTEGAAAPPAASGGPAVGQVVDGYRFKGGNPADRNSWELVK